MILVTATLVPGLPGDVVALAVGLRVAAGFTPSDGWAFAAANLHAAVRARLGMI